MLHLYQHAIIALTSIQLYILVRCKGGFLSASQAAISAKSNQDLCFKVSASVGKHALHSFLRLCNAMLLLLLVMTIFAIAIVKPP